MQIKREPGRGANLGSGTLRRSRMEIPEIVDWLLNRDLWVMLFGGLLGLFGLGLFAGMHRCRGENSPPRGDGRARRE